MSEHRPVPRTTTDSVIPVTSDEHSLTAGPTGPTLLQGAHRVQKMQPFNRERIPERVAHARAAASVPHAAVEPARRLRETLRELAAGAGA